MVRRRAGLEQARVEERDGGVGHRPDVFETGLHQADLFGGHGRIRLWGNPRILGVARSALSDAVSLRGACGTCLIRGSFFAPDPSRCVVPS